MQGTTDPLRGKIATRKAQLIYSEVKMQQIGYSWDT